MVDNCLNVRGLCVVSFMMAMLSRLLRRGGRREREREGGEEREREERGENFIPKVQKRTLAFSMKLRF